MLIQGVFSFVFSTQSHHNTSRMLFIFVKCDINQRQEGALGSLLEIKQLSQSANVIKMHQGAEKNSYFFYFKLVYPPIAKKKGHKMNGSARIFCIVMTGGYCDKANHGDNLQTWIFFSWIAQASWENETNSFIAVKTSVVAATVQSTWMTSSSIKRNDKLCKLFLTSSWFLRGKRQAKPWQGICVCVLSLLSRLKESTRACCH